MTIYFAYGSNLNLDQMRWRCPRARPMGSFTLKTSRLVFRGVADCIYDPDSDCPGGLWRITDQCEAELDMFEGVASGTYRKEWIPLTGVEGETRLLLYVATSRGIMPPSKRYLDKIIQGYSDFGLPFARLREAVERSYREQNITRHERKRLQRECRNLPAVKRSGVKTGPTLTRKS